MRLRFALPLAALLVPLTVPLAMADTVEVDDRFDDRSGSSIRRVVVDNTADMVGATARHVNANWTGWVRLAFDVGGGPRAEYEAWIDNGPRQARRFILADGTPWRCPQRVSEAATETNRTLVTAPRSCFGGAATMRVRVQVEASDGTTDRAASPVVHQQSQPNIVMIMLDDMREDDLAYMPRTQELIGDAGVRFANSLAPYPLCCPARASVLTGQYAHNHRVWSHQAPWGFTSFDDRSTLATWLQGAGYSTTYIGKYLNGYGAMPAPGQTEGNSTLYVPPGWSDWRASIDGGLPADHPDNGGTYRYNDTTLANNGVGFYDYTGQYQSRVYGQLSDEVVSARAASDQPFFLYVSYTAPHHGAPREADDPAPVTNDAGFVENFGTPAVPASARGMFDDVITQAPGADWFRTVGPLDKPEYLRGLMPMNDAEQAALLEVTRQRAESLSVVDNQVARTIDALARSGELEETLVLLTSDNGYFLGEQGIRTGKILPHEPAIHTPLLMRGPGIPAGQTRYDPFLSIDFAPTLADFADVEPALPVDGVSMLSVARYGDQGWSRAVLTETGPRGTVRNTDEAGQPLPVEDPGQADIRFAIGVRSDRYLYTSLANGDEELYDMAVDPDQYDNLVNNALYADVLRLMREQLQEVRACDAQQCRASLPPRLRRAPGESIRNPA